MIQPQYFQQQYPQAPSAVSINIYEPKSYGSAPAQQAPYAYSNQLYGMPQSSAWSQQPLNYAQSPYQQYAIPQIMPQAAIGQPVETSPVVNQQFDMAQPVAPQPMPQTAIDAQQNPPVADSAQQSEMPEVEQGQETPKVNADALLADLKSPDYNVQNEAITSIANFSQSTPDIALQVVTDPIKQALVDIIKTDTSALPDLTDEQKAISVKKEKGEEITPEEQATLDKSSPRIMADKNRVFALFTLAMIQKLSRDNEAQYAQFQSEQGKQAPSQLALKDLMGYNEIVNTIQNDNNGQLRAAAIQALQYIAKPEEKAEVEQILQPALNDSDESVKQVAQDALSKLGQAPQEGETTQEQEVATNNETQKEQNQEEVNKA